MEPSISFSHESNLFTVPLTHLDEIWTEGERLATMTDLIRNKIPLQHKI
jgi:hypothetical protein